MTCHINSLNRLSLWLIAMAFIDVREGQPVDAVSGSFIDILPTEKSMIRLHLKVFGPRKLHITFLSSF
jgi:hypothetical protein